VRSIVLFSSFVKTKARCVLPVPSDPSLSPDSRPRGSFRQSFFRRRLPSLSLRERALPRLCSWPPLSSVFFIPSELSSMSPRCRAFFTVQHMRDSAVRFYVDLGLVVYHSSSPRDCVRPGILRLDPNLECRHFLSDPPALSWPIEGPHPDVTPCPSIISGLFPVVETLIFCLRSYQSQTEVFLLPWIVVLFRARFSLRFNALPPLGPMMNLPSGKTLLLIL